MTMEVDGRDQAAPAAEVPEAAAGTKPPSVQEQLKSAVLLLEKAVKQKDTKLGRLMRQTAALRKSLDSAVLSAFIKSTLPAELESTAFLLNQVGRVGGDVEMQTEESTSGEPSSTPEVEMYVYLLVLVYAVDQKNTQQAKALAGKALERLAAFNRRTLDVIASRLYFYYSLVYENAGELADIRSNLLALHRTAVLRHDAIGQETLMNLLLRNYLHYSLYDQAEKFRSKAHKSDVFRSNQQFCRYLYFLGRIRTIQLEYSDAKECLQQAVRKAPSSAHGFRVAASKWLILVRLLLGEIPERQEFAQPGLGRALQPYLELTQAVRSGDLVEFGQVAQRCDAQFREDRVRNLITRLHHNVIRTGLRRINLAYSRISLADVAAKLHLPSVEDAEFIVAKAIRDGGIEAVINHDQGYMASRDVADIYSTGEPQAAFHARVAFCLDIHNDAIKAMRFEPDAHKKKLESAEARKERLAQEAELAQAIAEDDDEF